jgi:60 kDa SS-A/Ro ribonucleoprotein
LFNYITHGKDEGYVLPDNLPALVYAVERLSSSTVEEVIDLIREFHLPREVVPTEMLNQVSVWEALLEDMPMTAMIRNLGKMSSIGLLTPLSSAETKVTQALTGEQLTRSRVHPFNILVALATYSQGHGARGHLEWEPNARIVDALDNAFYESFGNVESTNKPTMLALDVSGSMDWDCMMGAPGVTPRRGSAAMAMITARVETACHICAFSHEMVPIVISPRQRLDDIINTVDRIPMGRTDCAQPMIYALKNKIPAEVFVVYTDSETWCGRVHPVQALQEYRDKMGIPAKLVVVGMVSNGFSIADPNDGGMLDVVGFDSSTPQIISGFALGNI